MNLYNKKDFRYIISFFIFFFSIWFYIVAYLSTLSIFLLIPSLTLIIIFLFKKNIIFLYIHIFLIVIYFLLFKFFPSEYCGSSSFKELPKPVGINIKKSCKCLGIIKYTNNLMEKECIGKIVE